MNVNTPACPETLRRLMLAFRHGVIFRMNYFNLDGVKSQRDCYVKEMNWVKGFAIVHHRDFGYRTIYFHNMDVPAIAV